MSTQTSVILLVEDDPSLQDSLKTFLEESGFETHAAGSRSQGQTLLRSLRPSV
jgi:DNA-binding response OmpR family regulator